MKKLMITIVLMFLLLPVILHAQSAIDSERMRSIEVNGVEIEIGDKDAEVFMGQKGWQTWLLNRDIDVKILILKPKKGSSWYYSVTFQSGVVTMIEKVTHN